jgi:putative endonuclease
MNTREYGKLGEEIAANFLVDKGLVILDRNYSTPLGEIDIIARDKDSTLVFAEVKTAYTASAGDPASWVNKKKQMKVGRVASAYLATHQRSEEGCRFDVLGVVIERGKEPAVTHYENAFMLTGGEAFLWP